MAEGRSADPAVERAWSCLCETSGQLPVAALAAELGCSRRHLTARFFQGGQQFLVTAFGFQAGRIDRDGDGHIVHGEVSVGDEVIWLHRATAEHGLCSPRAEAQASGGLAIVVDDVDAHYEHARAVGARIDRPPIDQPYGRREYEARDPEGHRWWFASLLS